MIGRQLDRVILEVFSNLSNSDSMILFGLETYPVPVQKEEVTQRMQENPSFQKRWQEENINNLFLQRNYYKMENKVFCCWWSLDSVQECDS